MEPEDNSLSLVYRDKESLRSIFFPPILIVPHSKDGLIFRDEDGDLANTFQCEAVIILSFIPMSFLHFISMARKRLCYFSNR